MSATRRIDTQVIGLWIGRQCQSPLASQKMTRRLPEGSWDPTKIPRFQNLMSEARSQVGVGGIQSSQVKALVEGTRKVREIQLDGLRRSHNPKVGG